MSLPVPATDDPPFSSENIDSTTNEQTTPTFRPRGIHEFLHRHENSDEHKDSGFGSIAGSWWGDHHERQGSTRPWANPPKRRKTIPPDQTAAYNRTKEAVGKAAVSVLGTEGVTKTSKTAAILSWTADIGHEVLLLSADALRLAPIVGLAEAARVLLSIWDSVEDVETNRLQCLRLTERCATILSSIREEISTAGPVVAETLADPLVKLTESFRRVEHFIQKQVSRPFLKRYLKRDEDAIKITMCDQSLTDSVGLFSVAIQVRLLKAVKTPDFATHEGSPHAAIAAMGAAQTKLDAAADNADLYAAMRAALRTRDDAAILEILQIKRGDLAEAMKTIQRALDELSPKPTPTEGLGLSGVSTAASSTTAVDTWVPVSPHQPSTEEEWDKRQDEAFHREFLESGLDALCRISGSAVAEILPPWTITRWEVDREERIGVGFFSDVFRGTWRGKQVAIKVLAPTTPRSDFKHEAHIWASLKHPHVLELLGASSATCDPPWFFVSPYMHNGTLVSYLRAVAAGERPHSEAIPSTLQMMHEIARGMAYLHSKGVWHGDLKANNVLIDDELRCVITDFGLSKIRSEVFRLSNKPQPHGSLRWQAPEIMNGTSVLTAAADVYAFAILCTEILSWGELPWAMLDDQTVQQLVLHDDKRPALPSALQESLAVLIAHCWTVNARVRPSFEKVSRRLAQMRGVRHGSPSPHARALAHGLHTPEHSASPDLMPVDLPPVPEMEQPVHAADIPLQRVVTRNSVSTTEDDVRGDDVSDVFISSPEDESVEGDEDEDLVWNGYESPPPRDERIAARRNERRYRFLLQHSYNPSLNLPLWEPTPVKLGAVGYLCRPSGTFVTLFNAYNPAESAIAMASIHGYGEVREGVIRQNRKTFAQAVVQVVQGLQGLLMFTNRSDGTFSRPVTRRHSFPLRAGHKHAYLCTENTVYRYMINTRAAKAWFKANIKEIVRLYGAAHNIQREDFFLIVGALETREWGLFVSHEHPDGQVHFNVYSDRREGQYWGSFSTDTTTTTPGTAGPEADAEPPGAPSVHASKISPARAASDPSTDAILLARLRFRPDVDDPTHS